MSYSTVTEFLNFGMSEASTSDMEGIDLGGFLGAASSRIRTYARTGGYDVDGPLPLNADTTQLKAWEWILAKYAVLQKYGFDFLARNAASIEEQYKEAMAELKLMSEGKLNPFPVDPTTGETQDADPTDEPGGAAIVSDTLRGW